MSLFGKKHHKHHLTIRLEISNGKNPINTNFYKLNMDSKNYFPGLSFYPSGK
jgi:hypothetical protein